MMNYIRQIGAQATLGVALLALAASGGFAQSADAQRGQLLLPVSQQGKGNVQTPRRGISQQQVLDRFGEPQQRYSTVGEPPITRWDYSQFSVYFEGDKVLHSVLRHQG